MITFRDVSKSYDGHLAVDRINLHISPGEKHILIGTSGSGKTTLLKMINKLIPRSAGKIFVEDQDIDDWDAVHLRRRLGYVIQQVGLFPHLTISQNIGMVPRVLGWPQKKIETRVGEVLLMAGLDARYLPMYPDALSGGQQQRVGIARALAADPDILLMDEPFGALDPITRAGLRQEFTGLPGIRGKTVIMVTHDMQEAAMLGDVITVLDHGRIQQSGKLRDLLFRPANEFVQGFLEDQRETLELQAVPVALLTPWLQEAEPDDEAVLLSPENVLQDVPAGKNTILKADGYTFRATREICLSVFYQHRQRIIDQLTIPDGDLH